jgi:Fibronectin type III domain
MRSKSVLTTIALLTVLGAGCDPTSTTTVQPKELAPPLGLTSVTGSGAVTLQWRASNYDEGREGFQVYQASGTQPSIPGQSIPGAFGTTPVATLTANQEAGTFTKTVTGLTDGTTYSFLVVAFKDGGNKLSRPSDVITDTPRRESATTIDLTNGVGNVRFIEVGLDPLVASASATGADVLCQSFNAGAGDRPGMVGQSAARVQDLGFVATWDEIDEAPLGSGSYPDASHSVEILIGHVYAVFTGDNHYAKIWITDLHSADFGYICRVAYQPQAGNNELKPTPQRP